jgi:protein-L-isoaspartate(D-aspartate) O-methyltransferase
MKALFYLAISVFLAAPTGAQAEKGSDPYAHARRGMIEAIRNDAASLHRELPADELNADVLQVLGSLARHEFVPEKIRAAAYENRTLPIGYGQTISQPFIVALMTDLLKLKPGDRVLEVGTGSGYQAAVLARLGARAHSIEIIAPLGEAARVRLRRLGFDTVAVRVGDGYYGWEEAAPFDAIIVTAAANHIPPPLIAQLRTGGRMVVPVGNPFGAQHLVIVRKDATGRVTTQKILPVRFVPLTGRESP